MSDNPYESIPLPSLDPDLDREYNDISGNATSVKLSQYLDHQLMLVSKTKGQTMAGYVKAAITKQLQIDTAEISETVSPATLQKTYAVMLNKRRETRIKKQQTVAKNRANRNKAASAE